MENGILIVGISSLASFVILYFIIQFAVNSSNMSENIRTQTKLLTAMAKKSGVSQEEINDCYK